MAWNKAISQYRYSQILTELRKILKDWKPEWSKGKKKEWSKVTDSQWQKLAQIPEFDLEVTKGITGLSAIPIHSENTIEIEGKKFTVEELKEIISKA